MLRAKELFSNSRFRLFGLIWFWAFLCHIVQILRYSNSLPFGDQWDGEALTLLKPWVEGNLTVAQMFSAHNEHRIFFTRVFDLLVFTLNSGYWDNRAFAVASAALYATLYAFLGTMTLKIENQVTRYALLVLIFCLPITTANYENTLWGFQSSFYFLSLFAVLTIRILSKGDLSLRNFAAVVCLSSFSLCALASGFLLAPIAAAMIIAGPIPHGDRNRRIVLVLVLCAIATLGFLMVPKIVGHEVLRAQSAVEFIASMMKTLAWPVPIFPVAWLPIALWLYFLLSGRQKLLQADKFFLGLAAWVFIQAAAIAYSRGHALVEPPSRYTDILMIGLVANLYFCCQLFYVAKKITNTSPRRFLESGTWSIILITGISFCFVSLAGLYSANNNRFLMQNNFIVTRALLKNPAIQTENFSLPYPNKAALLSFLIDPTIRQLLRIDQQVLPISCDADHAALLSQIICSGEYIIPQIAFQAFSPVKSPTADDPSVKCNIDLLIGTSSQKILSPYLPLRLAGWVISNKSSVFSTFSHHDILLVGKDAEFSATSSAIRRPDVAAALGSMNYYWSGFDVTASVSELSAGSYEVIIKDPEAGRCHTNVYVQMRSIGDFNLR